jgi:hypothetical protein
MADPCRLGDHSGQALLGSEIHARRRSAEVAMRHVRPFGAGELLTGLAQQEDGVAIVGEAHRHPIGDVGEDAKHSHDRRRVDGRRAGLVVEADVAASDWNAEFLTAVGEPAHGLGELPHDRWVFGRAEVEAVRHGDRRSAGHGDVAICLGQCQLRTGVRVEAREACVAVNGQGDAQPAHLVNPQHTRVLGLCEHGVAEHVPVVLFGDPRLVAQIRRSDQAKKSLAELIPGSGTRQRLGPVHVEEDSVVRLAHRSCVDRPVVGE